MCGRFIFTPGLSGNFRERFEVENEIPLEDRYNVAPGQLVPVDVRKSPDLAENMKWGLIPFWAKDPRIAYKLINARAESAATKPSFRKAFRTQRCLVPANGFYEWKTGNGKTPYFIHRKDAALFAFAGLYDIWKDAEGYEVKTFTILTVQPNSLVSAIHNRMPAILKEEDEEIWLDPQIQDPATLLPLLAPFNPAEMEAYPVSTAVNSARNEGKELIKRMMSSG